MGRLLTFPNVSLFKHILKSLSSPRSERISLSNKPESPYTPDGKQKLPSPAYSHALGTALDSQRYQNSDLHQIKS